MFFTIESPDPEFILHDNAAWRARVTAARDQALAKKDQVEAELDAVSANTTSADGLWPAGLYAWQDFTRSRNLTGAGTNRFIAVLATGWDAGNYPSPVAAGSLIGPNTSALSGGWHHDTGNLGNPALNNGSGLSVMQSVNAYIGVEFQAADGIHYGWIHYGAFGTPNYFPIYDIDGNLIGYSEDGLDMPGGIIDAWAWETEPGSLLLCLSAGALGLLRCRRLARR